jgi:molecular chaperone GrpE
VASIFGRPAHRPIKHNSGTFMASDQEQPASNTPKANPAKPDSEKRAAQPSAVKPDAADGAAQDTSSKSSGPAASGKSAAMAAAEAALASLQERMGMGGSTDAAKDATEGNEKPDTPKHHDDLIADLRREISDLKDKILRAHAEVDNIRKRTEREKIDTAKYAITKFANDIVNVGDNFQRATTTVPEGAADADPALASLLEGVTLTEREFLNVLDRHGVERVNPMGEAFDPHLHQAVMEMPQPDVAAGTVVQVFQSGYTIEGRVLRPAMVVVATGGDKPGASAEAKATSRAPDGGA